MAVKSANLYARIGPDVKEQAEIILNRGLPFEVKIPNTRPVSVAVLSEAQLNKELEKGYVDMVAGKTKPAKQVFADIRKDI